MNHYVVHLNLIKYCKSTIHQFKIPFTDKKWQGKVYWSMHVKRIFQFFKLYWSLSHQKKKKWKPQGKNGGKDITEKSTQKFALKFPQMNKQICSKMLRFHIVQDGRKISPLLVKVSENKQSLLWIEEGKLCSHSQWYSGKGALSSTHLNDNFSYEHYKCMKQKQLF